MSISALGESWVRGCSHWNLFFLRLQVTLVWKLGLWRGPKWPSQPKETWWASQGWTVCAPSSTGQTAQRPLPVVQVLFLDTLGTGPVGPRSEVGCVYSTRKWMLEFCLRDAKMVAWPELNPLYLPWKEKKLTPPSCPLTSTLGHMDRCTVIIVSKFSKESRTG